LLLKFNKRDGNIGALAESAGLWRYEEASYFPRLFFLSQKEIAPLGSHDVRSNRAEWGPIKPKLTKAEREALVLL
jgi:hypothetical protein